MSQTKSNIREAVVRILAKDLNGMKESFNAAITNKAVEKLEEKKNVIAQSYFGKKD